MDHFTTNPRARNPKETANLFQTITFLFTIPIFRKGLKKDLDESDVYDIIPEYKAEKLGSYFENVWNQEKKKTNPKLLNCYWKLFGLQFVLLGIFNAFTKTFLIVAQPILIGEIVSYFTPNQEEIPTSTAWYYCLAFILCNFSYVITIHSYMFGIEQLSLKVQLACCNLIYRKCLALNSVSTSEVAAGQAVTLITKDIGTFYFSIHFAQQLCVGAIQTVLMTYVMYREIQGAAFAGILLLILFIPIQVYMGKFTSKFRLKTAAKTDQRVKITQEILTAMRIIKMYIWEIFFYRKMKNLRKSEIKNLRVLFYIKSVVVSIGHLTSRFGFYVCIITYVGLGNHITAQKAFVTLGCFAALRSVLTTFIPLGITQMATLKASLHRITNFLLLEEVMDQKHVVNNNKNVGKICLTNVTVQTSKNLTVLDNINFIAKTGVTVVIGPNGSGKSTLLRLLLGDVSENTGTVEVNGNTSYASQDPWLFPASVRQNIIFGEEFDEDRYRKVLEICALQKDVSTFPKGDGTLVTDRGLNLSKGQKARISLARTIYKKADIYLIDDCLSSVDSRVGNHIFNKCIKSFLKDSTCILVTHNPTYLIGADNIIFLYKGSVNFSGDYNAFKQSDDINLKSCVHFFEEPIENSYHDLDLNDLSDINANESSELLQKPSEDSLKVYQEQKMKGSVNKKVYCAYLSSGGGYLMLILLIILFISTQASGSWSDYFVSFLVTLEQQLGELKSNNTTGTNEYIKLRNSYSAVMGLYSVAIAVTILLTFVRSLLFYVFSSNASINLHGIVMDKLLNSQMIFFDTNLSGNIINRFSRDLEIVDEHMPNVLFEFLRVILSVLGILVVVSTMNVYLIIPSVIFTVLLDYIRRLYMRTGRSLKRLEGSTRSPVIGHLNATLEGLAIIRASQAQSIVTKQFEKHQDFYNSTVHMNLATSRAFGFVTDLIACFYTGIITMSFLILNSNFLAGNVGLALTQAYTLTGLLQWGIRELAELENQMISTERFLNCRNAHAEIKSGRVFTSWPDKGKIVFKNISMGYTPTSDHILKGINFEIEPKQKIGIVGRTGAGKSSLISALCRLYYYEGLIEIDGVDIKKLSINYLRSKISVIPQDPVLFSGTIRSNMDPYERHSDEVLWDALDKVEIKGAIKSLDLEIHEGNSEFSSGEKQLMCLARAIIYNNNILVLDEATANMDSQTDTLIQKVIKKKFYDCTVITIAHKLQNILDNDKVMVLDDGKIVQFDSPNNLLNDENGLFYSMVKESGLM